MKNAFRRISAIAASIALALGGLTTIGASPASAAVRPVVAFNAVTKATINVPFDVDYSCAQDDPNGPATATMGTWANEPDMEMPPGLSLDLADGHIKGTPTEVGSFRLPLILCDRVTFNEGFGVGTILVAPASTPAPSLKAIALNDGNCSIRVIGALPSVPLAGSTTLTVSTENDATTLVLREYGVGELIDITLAMNNFITSAQNNPNVLSLSKNTHEATCGKNVNFVLGYSNQGAPVATATASAYGQTVAAEATVTVLEVVDQACKFRIIGSVPKLTDDNKLKIVVSASIGGWDIMFSGVTPDKPLDVVIDLKDPNALEDLENVASYFVWGEPFNCQNAFILAGVYYNGIGYGATVDFTYYATDTCAPGTYGKLETFNGYVHRVCAQAPRGTYVDVSNILGVPTPAPKGYYVATEGATSATKCPAGLTTELEGARSKNECYKQKFQTAKAIKTPTKLKFGGKFETAGRADAGLNLTAVATGSCTLTATTKTVKVNGKSVKQPRWVIKATKKAGNCKVTFSNEGDYTYKPFSVTKTIKVTKTGK